MTVRVWPKTELSARAKFTGEHVVKQFWLSFEGVKFDLDDAIQSAAEFSFAITVIDRNGGWEEDETRKLGWAMSCCEHVELYESCGMQWAKPHAKLQDLQVKVYHRNCQLGV